MHRGVHLWLDYDFEYAVHIATAYKVINNPTTFDEMALPTEAMDMVLLLLLSPLLVGLIAFAALCGLSTGDTAATVLAFHDLDPADPGLLPPMSPSPAMPRLPPKLTAIVLPWQRGKPPSRLFWRRFSSFFTVGLIRIDGNLQYSPITFYFISKAYCTVHCMH